MPAFVEHVKHLSPDSCPHTFQNSPRSKYFPEPTPTLCDLMMSCVALAKEFSALSIVLNNRDVERFSRGADALRCYLRERGSEVVAATIGSHRFATV